MLRVHFKCFLWNPSGPSNFRDCLFNQFRARLAEQQIGILAEAINTKILTKNLPDSPHSHPYSLHSHSDPPSSHPDFPHSHPHFPHSFPDSPRPHPDSPRSHPDSPQSHHSSHSARWFPIPAFTDSLIFWWWKVMILALIRRRCNTIGTINLEMSWRISLHSATLAKNFLWRF